VFSESTYIVGPYNTGFLVDYKDLYINHAMVFPHDSKTEPLVQLFVKPRFECGNCGVFKPGVYSYEDMVAHQVNYVGSLSIPEGIRVVLYAENHFTGPSIAIDGPRDVDLANDKDYTGWYWKVNSV
jgi:hypothetical protein